MPASLEIGIPGFSCQALLREPLSRLARGFRAVRRSLWLPDTSHMFRKPISHKAAQFTESVIREMTRLALQHGAINLSQGFPDFPAPEILKKAAADAIFADVNQYAITWGAPSCGMPLRRKPGGISESISTRNERSPFVVVPPKACSMF